jgi:hypothetical protein
VDAATDMKPGTHGNRIFRFRGGTISAALASGADCRSKSGDGVQGRRRTKAAGNKSLVPTGTPRTPPPPSAKKWRVVTTATRWKGGTNTRRTYGGEAGCCHGRRRREPWRLNRDHEVYNPAKMARNSCSRIHRMDVRDGA